MIIAFSGTDGAGKSTQIERLLGTLRSEGHRCTYIWARGGYTPIFRTVKRFLLFFLGRRGGKNMDQAKSGGYQQRREAALERPVFAWVWLTVAMIDMIFLYAIYGRILHLMGRMVLLDRYLIDTEIDFQRNYPRFFRPQGVLWRLLVRLTPQPDVHFFLTVPVDVSMKRSLEKHEPFPDSPETLTFRLSAYRFRVKNSTKNITPLDGRRPIKELSDLIYDQVRQLAEKRQTL